MRSVSDKSSNTSAAVRKEYQCEPASRVRDHFRVDILVIASGFGSIRTDREVACCGGTIPLGGNAVAFAATNSSTVSRHSASSVQTYTATCNSSSMPPWWATTSSGCMSDMADSSHLVVLSQWPGVGGRVPCDSCLSFVQADSTKLSQEATGGGTGMGHIRQRAED